MSVGQYQTRSHLFRHDNKHTHRHTRVIECARETFFTNGCIILSQPTSLWHPRMESGPRPTFAVLADDTIVLSVVATRMRLSITSCASIVISLGCDRQASFRFSMMCTGSASVHLRWNGWACWISWKVQCKRRPPAMCWECCVHNVLGTAPAQRTSINPRRNVAYAHVCSWSAWVTRP